MPRKYDLKLKNYVGDWDFDPNYVDWFLSSKKGKPVSVVIESLGGSTFSGVSIANSFKLHGDISVHFVGYNASAATIASLGAKHISIDKNGMYLVHNCSSFVCKVSKCNSDQLQALINELSNEKKELEKIDLNIASMYADRCKKPKEDLLDLMSKGGWITAEEALAWGFVDEVCDTDEKLPALSPDITASLIEHGVPLPPNADKKANLFSRIVDAVNSYFNIQPIQNMKKTISLINICAACAIQSLTIEDNKCALTEDELNSIENAMANANSKIDELNAAIKAKDAEIESLKSAPAATTSTVVNNDNSNSEVNDLKEIYSNARKMLNSI